MKCQADDTETGEGSAATPFQSGEGEEETPRPCPFCGASPEVGPADPKREGDAWGYVQCVNPDCATFNSGLRGHGIRIEDGEDVADDRGSAAYIQCAVRRWNGNKSKRSIDEGCKPDERTADSAWRFDIENAPTDRPILAHDRMSLMQNPGKPMVLTWFKYNGLEAWRDWDGDAHTSVTRWMAIPEVRRQIEEAGLPADTATTPGEGVGLTPKISQPKEDV
jgi:hypothetical protein